MPSRPQCEYVVGESGSGKTYVCGPVFLEAFLRDEHGVHWSNLPLKIDGLAKLTGLPVEKVEERIKLIPSDVMNEWAKGLSGPWDFFKDMDLKGAHVAIDEAHRYFGKQHSKEHLAKLGDWVGHLRHSGATCQFITQHEFKISTTARNEAGVETRIFNPNQRREKITGARWYDVLQFVSKWYGRRIGLSLVREGVSTGEKTRAFQYDSLKFIWHQQKYFAAYDSYNNIAAEGVTETGESKRPKEEWERYGWLRLLVWYIDRNTSETVLRLALVVAVMWAIPFGGAKWAVGSVLQGGVKAAQSLAAPKLANGESKPKPGEKGSPSESEPTLAKLKPEDAEKLKALAEINRTLAARLADAALYAEELTSLVAVVGDSCYWADGSTGKAGDNVETGAYRGRKIISVDAKSGRVELEGGTILRVGVLAPSQSLRVRSWVEAGKADSAPGVPGSATAGAGLSGGTLPAAGVSSGRINGAGAIGHGTGSGNELTPIPAPARRSIRMLRGGGTGATGLPRLGPVREDTTPNSPGNSGSDPRSGSDPDGGGLLPGQSETRGQSDPRPQDPAND